jgi:hypothetical protein
VEEIRARDNLSNSPTMMKLVFNLAKFLLFSVIESIITFIPEDNVVLEDLAPIGQMESWHRGTGAGLAHAPRQRSIGPHDAVQPVRRL